MPDQPLGPRARRAYETLLGRIQSGQWPPGARFPSQPELAAQLGIAPMTLRWALARLEADGLISSEHGRGTFVREPVARSVLIVDDEIVVRTLLHAHVTRAGYRVVEATSPATGLQAIESDPSIALLMSDLAMPQVSDGVEFVRTVRRRWPGLPVAAVTAFPDELSALHGTPECPVLVITKPFTRRQIGEALCLAIPPRSDAMVTPRPLAEERRPVLLADEDQDDRAVLKVVIRELGYDVEEASTSGEALLALQRREFGHVIVDARMPGGGPQFGTTIAQAHPHTTVVVATANPEELSPFTGTITLLRKPFDEAGIRASLELQRTPIEPL